MNADALPLDILRHSLAVGKCPDWEMRRVADCVAAIRPAIMQASRDYGDHRTLCALAATLVDAAIETDDAPSMAQMLRNGAQILDLHDPDRLRTAFDP